MSESLVEKWERECAPMTNVAYVQALKDCARELKARDAKIRKIVEAIPCRCGAVAREGTRVVGRINPCAAHRILALLAGQPEEGKRG